MLLCHIERVGVDNARTAKQGVHYQPLRVQYDTKACNILFIACLTYDVDIQFQFFIVYWSTKGFSHLIMLIACDVTIAITVHYQHLRAQYDTKACYILFIACLTYDVDIQFQLFTFYLAITCISHLIMSIVVYIRWDVTKAIIVYYAK